MRIPPDPADRRRLARLRLAAQRLIGPAAASPVEAVRHMLAMQGQDYPGAKWSVGLRANASEAAVEAALDAGEIVRSWPMRGTLHLVAAEDLGWMLGLTAQRMMAGTEQRRQIVGLTLADVERARDVAIEALPGRTTLTRGVLLAALAEGGVPTDGQRGYHLLWYLSQTGTLVLGPTSGREQTYARLEAWVPNPRRLDRDEALGELAARYFASHGPASVEDLVRWTGLTVKDVRRGVQIAGEALQAIPLGGKTWLMSAGLADAFAAADAADAGVLLLPGFDEYILGYKDRSAMLEPDRFDAIVPGGNGMFKATIVADGEVVGTWGKKAGAKGVAMDLAPFEPLDRGVLDGVAAAADRYARYLGVPVRVAEAA